MNVMAPVLFAELVIGQNRYSQMGRRFRAESSSMELHQVLILLVSLAALAGLAWLIHRLVILREKKKLNSDSALFRELCRVHQLGWQKAHLLRQLARYHGISPVLMFLERSRLDVQQLPPPLVAEGERVAALQEELFRGA